MASQQQLSAIAELGRRGLLKPEQVAGAIELQRRGELTNSRVKQLGQQAALLNSRKQIGQDLSLTERVLAGIGRGFTDVAEGVKQAGGRLGESVARRVSGVDLPETPVDDFTRRAQRERSLFEQGLGDSTAAFVGRIAGNIAPALALPGAPAGAPLRTAVATEAAVGAGLGAASFVPEGQSRTEAATSGALFGGGVRGALGVLGKTVRLVRGTKQADRSANLQELADEFDVPLSAADVRGGFLNVMDSVLERIPLIGTKGFRQTQSQALKDAAEGVTRQFGGGDSADRVFRSLKRVVERRKAFAKQLFDNVDAEVQAINRSGAFPHLVRRTDILFTNTRRVAREILEDAKANTEIPKTETIRFIEGFAEAPRRTFDKARVLRSQVNAKARQIRKQAQGTGVTSDTDLAAITKLAQGIEADIAEMAARVGGKVDESFRLANRYFRRRVVPFKEGDLRKAVDGVLDQEEIIRRFIKKDVSLGGRTNSAKQLVSNLDLDGQQAVKAEILNDAFEAATRNNPPNVPFVPQKFVNRLSQLEDASGVVFRGAERQQINGLMELTDAAQRAGRFADNPPTGLRLLEPLSLLGGGVAFGTGAITPGEAAAGATGIFAMSLLLTTRVGRQILASSSRGASRRLQTQAENEIANILARLSAQQGAN